MFERLHENSRQIDVNAMKSRKSNLLVGAPS